MKVLPVTPRGYCKGVVRAIQLAKKTVQDYPDQKITILGMIVHNTYIVDALTHLGITTIDHPKKSRLELLDDIDEGIVLITAHGASDEVYKKAKDKGLKVIDATCVDVIKTHDLIREELSKGHEILYIGKKGHPEAEGTLAIHPEKVHLITSIEDIDAYQNHDITYVMTNQTTMSIHDVYHLCEHAKAVLKHVEICKETCQATTIRQEAISNIDEDVDVVFIIGDPRSNNTTRLASIAKEKAGKETYMIGSLDDLEDSMLEGKHYAAVSSGASTPTYLTNQVIQYLKDYPTNKPALDLSKILD